MPDNEDEDKEIWPPRPAVRSGYFNPRGGDPHPVLDRAIWTGLAYAVGALVGTQFFTVWIGMILVVLSFVFSREGLDRSTSSYRITAITIATISGVLNLIAVILGLMRMP